MDHALRAAGEGDKKRRTSGRNFCGWGRLVVGKRVVQGGVYR